MALESLPLIEMLPLVLVLLLVLGAMIPGPRHARRVETTYVGYPRRRGHVRARIRPLRGVIGRAPAGVRPATATVVRKAA